MQALLGSSESGNEIQLIQRDRVRSPEPSDDLKCLEARSLFSPAYGVKSKGSDFSDLSENKCQSMPQWST